MDLASYLKISLKPILQNNFDSIIESGANSIGTAANLDSYTQSINLAQQQTSVIKEEDEQELDEDTGTPIKNGALVATMGKKNDIIKEHLNKLKNINVTPLNNYNGQ